MSDARATSALDYVLGRKLRTARTDAGLSQQALAARLGITFQQIQKYEKGANRIAASRLVSIAGVLGKPVSYFLEDAKEAAASARLASRNADAASSSEQSALMSCFAMIEDRKARRRVLDMARTLADAETSKRGPAKSKRNGAPKKPVRKAAKPRR